MVAQSVAELLADHVRLSVEGIDRMYLNVYVSRLRCAYGAVRFFRNHRGTETGYEAQASDERATYREVHIHQRREAPTRRLCTEGD
jgi:hypothetical protein